MRKLGEVNGAGMINGWLIPLNTQSNTSFRISLSVQNRYLSSVLISIYSALGILLMCVALFHRHERRSRVSKSTFLASATSD